VKWVWSLVWSFEFWKRPPLRQEDDLLCAKEGVAQQAVGVQRRLRWRRLAPSLRSGQVGPIGTPSAAARSRTVAREKGGQFEVTDLAEVERRIRGSLGDAPRGSVRR
jgi:hypothetical protein